MIIEIFLRIPRSLLLEPTLLPTSRVLGPSWESPCRHYMGPMDLIATMVQCTRDREAGFEHRSLMGYVVMDLLWRVLKHGHGFTYHVCTHHYMFHVCNVWWNALQLWQCKLYRQPSWNTSPQRCLLWTSPRRRARGKYLENTSKIRKAGIKPFFCTTLNNLREGSQFATISSRVSTINSP